MLVGITVFVTVSVLLFNLLVDVAYALLDPRVRVYQPRQRRRRQRRRRPRTAYASQSAQARS